MPTKFVDEAKSIDKYIGMFESSEACLVEVDKNEAKAAAEQCDFENTLKMSPLAVEDARKCLHDLVGFVAKRAEKACQEMVSICESFVPGYDDILKSKLNYTELERELKDQVLEYAGNPAFAQMAVRLSSIKDFCGKLQEYIEGKTAMQTVDTTSLQDLHSAQELLDKWDGRLRTYLSVAQAASLICITWKETKPGSTDLKYGTAERKKFVTHLYKQFESKQNKGKINLPEVLKIYLDRIHSAAE